MALMNLFFGFAAGIHLFEDTYSGAFFVLHILFTKRNVHVLHGVVVQWFVCWVVCCYT